MKVLITGANGFLGSALKTRLEFENHSVIAVPREMLYNLNKLRGFIRREFPTRIYHFAAYGNHYHQQESREILLQNIETTINLLEAIKDNKLIQFYNVSSSSVVLKHQTFYSTSKKATELITEQYRSQYGIQAQSVRPYSVFGFGEADHRFIPTVIRHIISGKTMQVDLDAQHDWIGIEDFIDELLDGEQEIGTGYSTSNREIIEHLQHISGKQLTFSLAKLRSYDTEEWKAPKEKYRLYRNLVTNLQKTYDYYHAKYNQEPGPQATNPGPVDQA